jgi:hypothetical protein
VVFVRGGLEGRRKIASKSTLLLVDFTLSAVEGFLLKKSDRKKK